MSDQVHANFSDWPAPTMCWGERGGKPVGCSLVSAALAQGSSSDEDRRPEQVRNDLYTVRQPLCLIRRMPTSLIGRRLACIRTVPDNTGVHIYTSRFPRRSIESERLDGFRRAVAYWKRIVQG